MKKKLFFLLLCAELIFLIFIGVRIFHTSDRQVLQAADPASVKNISLSAGTYRAWIDYTSNDSNNAITFISESAAPSFLADTLQLYPWRHADYIQLWAGKDCYDVSAAFHGDQNLKINSIRICQTNDSLRIFWVFAAAVFFILDLLLFWVSRFFIHSSDKKGILIRVSIIIASVFISCWPLHIRQLIAADDLTFHLERIEGISSALLSGQFPVRIFPTYFDGAGYAVSVFYGDILLYFPAFLRMMGFPLQTSLKAYVIFINTATAFVSWYVLSKILKDRWAAVFSASLYTLSLYRLGDIFIRSAVGEYTGMLFIPLVLGGFYLLFSNENEQNVTSASHLRTCRNMIAIGMTGLLTSHCILSILTAFFLFLWLLCYLKKLLHRKVLRCLVSSVVMTIALSAFFLIPFADYMLSGHFVINSKISAQDAQIQKNGITWKGLWNPSFRDTDMKTFGLIFCLLFLIFVIFLVLQFVRRKELSLSASGFRYDCSILFLMSALTIWMSTVFFPWNLLSEHFYFFSVLADTMQFPFRFASIAVFLGVLEAGICVRSIAALRSGLSPWKTIFLGFITCAVFINSFLALQRVSVNSLHVAVYDRAGLGLYVGYGTYQGYNIYDGAYLPENTDIRQFQGMVCTASGKDLKAGSFSRAGMSLRVSCRNSGSLAESLSVPFLYYKGYTAEDAASRQTFPVTKGNNATVTVLIPAGFHGTVHVYFAEPWYWRCAELVSLLCWSALFLSHFIHKKLHILHP